MLPWTLRAWPLFVERALPDQLRAAARPFTVADKDVPLASPTPQTPSRKLASH